MAQRLIQVCGDPTVDWLNIRNDGYVAPGGTYFWQPQTPHDRVRLSSQPGGSLLIAQLLREMVPPAHAQIEAVEIDQGLLDQPKDSPITTSWTMWQRYVTANRPPVFRLAEWHESE
jgi:hypothetical protein